MLSIFVIFLPSSCNRGGGKRNSKSSWRTTDPNWHTVHEPDSCNMPMAVCSILASIGASIGASIFASHLNNDLERIGIGRMSKRVIGLKNLSKFEMMGNEQRRIEFFRFNDLEKHRCTDRIHQPCRYRQIAIPQVLQMQIDFCAMHTNIGDRATCTDNFLAKLKGCRDPYRLDGRINASPAG